VKASDTTGGKGALLHKPTVEGSQTMSYSMKVALNLVLDEV